MKYKVRRWNSTDDKANDRNFAKESVETPISKGQEKPKKILRDFLRLKERFFTFCNFLKRNFVVSTKFCAYVMKMNIVVQVKFSMSIVMCVWLCELS